MVYSYSNINYAYYSGLLTSCCCCLLGSIIVHIMTPQMRNFYKLERRWKDAEVVETSFLLEGGEGLPSSSGTGRSEEEDSDDDEEGAEESTSADIDEEDPFWK